MEVTYYIDGIDLKSYSVYINKSDGLLSRPKLKQPVTASWKDYHGDVVDLSKRYYESRKISLDCFIKASNKEDFLTKMNEFMHVFDASGTRRLMVVVDVDRPLVYEVYLSAGIEPKKTWSDSAMVGTFSLELTEPTPIKRVVKVTGTSLSITLTSTKLVDMYWGDGTATKDVSGTSKTVTKTYGASGTYYAIVAGNIDEITAFSTTGTVLWSKL